MKWLVSPYVVGMVVFMLIARPPLEKAIFVILFTTVILVIITAVVDSVRGER